MKTSYVGGPPPLPPPWVQLPPRTPLGHLSGISYGIHFGLTPPGYGATDSTSSHVHDIDIDRRNQTNHASSFVLPLGHRWDTSWAPLMASTLVQLLRGGFGIRCNRFNKLTGCEHIGCIEQCGKVQPRFLSLIIRDFNSKVDCVIAVCVSYMFTTFYLMSICLTPLDVPPVRMHPC